MAYVEIIKRGNKQYYHLTKNVRLGINKWKKIRVYIGEKKPLKKELEKHARKVEESAKALIKHANYLYISDHDAETLQDIKEGYKDWLKKTPKSLKEKLNEDFMIRFTYNTNAIEGNRLTLRQTALILKDKVIPSGVRANDYNEAINGKECLDFLREYKGDFNEAMMCKINGILTKNTDTIYGGRVRFFDVKIQGSSHVPPPHSEVKHHLLNLFKWYSKNKRKLHSFELAVLVHAKLTWIHPFEDGNGRTARAIMNFILMEKGYPMFFIPFEKREAYYMALEKADKENYREYTSDLVALIIDQIRSYGHKKK
ncbi:MAG: Fic family protein [Nanoarchaeota archaeon]|nr:Fic family protein [Nanoarchaeota archaeon]